MINIRNIIDKYNIIKVEPIDKGWSVDEKYIMIDQDIKNITVRLF